MSWPQVAGPHVGHRLTLKDAWNLRCIDCAMTLVIHRESAEKAPTPTPPRWRRPDVPLASPEVVALRKREALAAIEQARLRRTSGPDGAA